jgi:hypothetical protein
MIHAAPFTHSHMYTYVPTVNIDRSPHIQPHRKRDLLEISTPVEGQVEQMEERICRFWKTWMPDVNNRFWETLMPDVKNIFWETLMPEVE